MSAGPQHGPSWAAGYFHDYGSCQNAGRHGQWRHQWGRFECQRGWDKSYGNRHGDWRDGHRRLDSPTWVLTVWR